MPSSSQPFQICLLGPRLIEVKVSDGIELLEEHADAMHRVYAELSKGEPYALLVDKTNQYSYSFAFQRKVLDQPNLLAAAFVICQPAQHASIASLLAVAARIQAIPIEVFHDRQEALAWLASHGATSAAPT